MVRKFIFNAFVVSMSALVMSSCHKEEMKPEEPSDRPEIPSQNDGILTFTSEEMDSVKTEWNGSTILWSDGDAISVAYTHDEAWSATLFNSEPVAVSDRIAKFTVSTDLTSEVDGSLTFYGIYPAVAKEADFSAAPSVKVTIPSAQKPAADSFDKSADIMIARSYYDYDSLPDENIPLLWQRIVAHADMTLSNLSLDDDEQLDKVALTVQEGAYIAGSFALDITTGDCEPLLSESYNQLTVDVSSLTVSEEGALKVWIGFLPSEFASLSIELITTKSRYFIEIPDFDKEFKANARNIIDVDMSKAEKRVLPQGVYRELFDVIDIDYPGLESVKAEYLACNYEAAADALVDYYRNRTVVNPRVVLSETSLSNEDRRVADQSLEHRFCVRRSYWYESVSEDGKSYTYWDFDDENGEINWDFELPGAGQENYQVHWHQWFKYVAWAQVVTGDDKYFNNWKEIYSDWLEHFPCPGPDGSIHEYGNSSWRELSVATRISSQIDLLPYFLTSESFTGDWLATVLVEMHKAVEFCRAKPYYSPSSNIRFAQLTAQADAAMLMPEFKAASDWLSEVAPQISSQFSLQFYDDGVHNEMAPNYQLGVVSDFLTIYKVADANDRLSEFDPEYRDKLKKACLFIANYVWPDYTWEWFNDTFRQTKNVLLRNIKEYSALFPEENVLTYLASQRKEGYVPTESLIPFSYGGYYIFRTGWDGNETMFILKNNFNPSNMSHCHMDNGTFALWSKGRNFFPDSGVYTYGGDEYLDAKREEHLATASHNTLTKNLETIADDYSNGECKLTRTSADEDLVVTRNQSYNDLTHRRAVYMLEKKFFVIVDDAYGSAADDEINLSFHLCDGTVVTDDFTDSYAYGVHTEFSDGNDMLVRTFSETTRGYKAETGVSACSQVMNQSYDRTYYRVTVDKRNASDVCRFITVIYPSREAEISASFTSEFDQNSSSVKVTINGKEYNLSYEF